MYVNITALTSPHCQGSVQTATRESASSDSDELSYEFQASMISRSNAFLIDLAQPFF